MYNPILNTDSYKASHFKQYPPDTLRVSSYIEARGIANDWRPVPEVVHFGLQMFLKEYMSVRITHDHVAEAMEIFKAHGEPFNDTGWNYIVEKHNGRLPVSIQALPEGTVIPLGTCQVQIVNTDIAVPWLTSYLETALLRAVWYPSTVATISREAKKIIYQALQKTCDDPDSQIGFKLHDFGARGVSSNESAMIGGCAHLVNFLGTDTVASLVAAKRYYNEPMAGFSIPAAEHSTITAWGRDNEVAAFRNMLKQFGGPGKLVACVSDSYDIYGACAKLWGEQLKDEVQRMGGTLVVRPDSGNPPTVVLKVVELLADKFGFTANKKGFKVLAPCVRVIQGDGIDLYSIQDILNALILNGWSTENVAFGMGGGLLQKLDRDTLKYAMKANAIYRSGQWHDVYKEPITDRGKDSKRGRLAVTEDLRTIKEEYLGSWPADTLKNILVPVWENGELLKEWNLTEVRERARLW